MTRSKVENGALSSDYIKAAALFAAGGKYVRTALQHVHCAIRVDACGTKNWLVEATDSYIAVRFTAPYDGDSSTGDVFLAATQAKNLPKDVHIIIDCEAGSVATGDGTIRFDSMFEGHYPDMHQIINHGVAENSPAFFLDADKLALVCKAAKTAFGAHARVKVCSEGALNKPVHFRADSGNVAMDAIVMPIRV